MLTHSTAPIGIFDSGLGGLTVLAALREHLPLEHFLYFADTRYLPYGDRPEDFLRERGLQISAYLADQGAKAIVIACNTATAAAAESIRAHCHLPVIALEPAVKPAAEACSDQGCIGVLATTRTLKSQRFQQLLKAYAHKKQVIPQACPGLAEAIENEGPESPSVAALLDVYLKPLSDLGVEVVVLGCTHYAWVRQGIARRLPENAMLIDTGEAVARQVRRRLAEAGLLNKGAAPRPEDQWSLVTSGETGVVQRTLQRLSVAVPRIRSSDL